MANNRIGIQVQVEFPTIAELQSQLAKKWQSVKRDFDGKINISVDGHSLNRIKKQIQDALDEKPFQINLDNKLALGAIAGVQKELKELDAKIDKVREIKIKFDVSDMDKSMKDIINNNKKIQDDLDEQDKKTKKQTSNIEDQIGRYDKLVRKIKEVNGEMVTVEAKVTTKNAGGNTLTETIKPSGSTYEETDDRLKALKEIQDAYRDLYKIRKDMLKADGEHADYLKDEEKRQVRIVNTLSDMYYQKNGSAPKSDSEELRHYDDAQKANIKNLQAQQELAKQKKEQLQDAQKYVALEQKIHSLKMKQVTALEGEKSALNEQIAHYERIQAKVSEKLTGEKKLTAEQEEQIANLRTINSLEQSRAEAKKKQQALDAETAREQREASKQLMASMNDIHKIRMKIAQIETRRDAGGDFGQREEAELRALQQQLAYQRQNHSEDARIYGQQRLITAELRQQLALQSNINSRELSRVGNASRVQVELEQASRAIREQDDQYKRLLDTEKNILKMQRDMIFSGMRERDIIQQAIRAERDRASAIQSSLETQGLLTNERRRELQTLRETAREQSRLSVRRQQAREKDQAYNDVGGLVDPHDTYSYMRQGFDAILKPMTEIDTAFYQVAKVADASRESLDEFKSSAFDVGTTLGTTASEYMQAVETWVTAGKSFEESQELGQVSQIGSFVGNINPADMVRYMAVPMNAFEKEGVKAVDIINVMNETANNHAIEMEHLGKAYLRSASTVTNAGVSFEELTGLITGAQEATRIGGERIGTALKTVSINYNMIKSQFTKDNQKKFDFLEGIGVNLEETDGLMEGLEQLRKVWNDLSDEDQNYAVYALAGKEHSNVVNAIIKEWDTVQETIKDANDQMRLGKDGSAFIEFAKQSDSLRFKLAELRNMWDKLMVGLGESDGAMAGVLDAFIDGLKMLSNLAENPALMNLAKMIVGMVAVHASANLIRRFWDTLSTGSRGSLQNIRDVRDAWRGLRRDIEDTADSTRDFNRENDQRNRSNNANASDLLDVDTDVNRRNRNGNNGDNDNDLDRNRNTGNNGNSERLDADTSSVAKLGSALGKTLSLFPLLGDALILLEIAGVPVFDKIGQGLDAMFKSTQDNLVETEALIKKFKGANDLINGTVDATRAKVGSLQKDAIEAGVIKKDENGNLTAGKNANFEDIGEFKDFRDEFNNQAEKMGLVDENGVKIRITMNDTTHILEAMKAMNAEKKELSKEAQIKVGEQIGKSTASLGDKETDVAVSKNNHNEAVKKVDEIKAKLKELKDANGDIIDEDAYKVWTHHLGNAEKKVKETKKSLDSASKAYKATQNDIKSNARALMAEGKAFDASNMSKQDAIATTQAMLDQYGAMKSESNTLASIQKKLAKGTELTNDEYTYLIENFKEADGAGKNQIETNGELQQSILKTAEERENDINKTLEAGEVAMTTAGERAGMEETVQGAIESTTGATQDSRQEIQGLNKDIKDIPAKKKFTVIIEEIGAWIMDKAKAFFGNSSSKTLKVNYLEGDAGAVDVGGRDSDPNRSVAVGSPSVSVGTTRTTSTGGRSSASVATGTNVRGAGGAIVSKSKSSGKETNNSRVSSDVWRYWNTEMKQSSLESAMRDLERAVTDAGENYSKVIKALTGQLSNLTRQKINLTTLKGQKDSEANSVLGKLKSYGFKVDTKTNSISNLSHAKNLKGEKAEKAEELLNTWNSLVSDLTGISDSIKDINSQIKATKEEIKQNKITDEAKKLESSIKRINTSLTLIGNHDALYSTRLSLIDPKDKELSLKMNEHAMARANDDLEILIEKFNDLSKTSVTYAENGETVKGTLEAIGQQILAQADNIIKYRQAINAIEFARINEDMQEFNATLDQQVGRFKDVTSNLSEGLLSGTDINDLKSSRLTNIDLSRKNAYEEQAEQRIALEKEVQESLKYYAQKNVEREKGVANTKISINAKMYNALLKMEKDYTAKKKVSAKTLTVNYAELDDIASIDEDYAKVAKRLEKYYNDVKKKQIELTNKYESDMKKAVGYHQKDAITDQFLIDSLEIEKMYFEAQIRANNQAIAELRDQLKGASQSDKEAILAQIATYQQSSIDAQNSIKDVIKSRFELELSLMSEVISETDKAKNALQNTLDILNSFGSGNHAGKGFLLNSILQVEKDRNAQIESNIQKLLQQQRLYEEGSYEWNILNGQVEQFSNQLVDSNRQLVEMNQNILANSFSATSNALERRLFEGKSHDAWQSHQQMWMEGLEKEIALEKMYKRMADLGTTVNKEKLDLLAKQEKLSNFEMDYLNKQLDIIELQDKVNNLSKERTIQVLKQNEFGQWDWTYEADATQLDKAKDDLNQAELDLKNLEDKAREDYLQQLNKILSDAQAGQFETVADFRKAMEDLGKAFETAVGDIPEINNQYIDELVGAYSNYIKENMDVISQNPVDSYLIQATDTMTDSLKRTFSDISASLGDIFATALLSKLNNTSFSKASKAITSGSTAISIDKLEFPNATDKDQIQEAILGLPQLALQKANSKV
ncbi:phage tail tape measure protein [Peribacillus asahii]|uniref:phage tail tape measure protein n=1 Tax=Peribacillus asahii TaxID=228899 RepID=UPI0038211746